TPTEATEYHLTVTSNTGCTATASVSVDVETGVELVTSPVGAAICQGQPLTLSVEATGPGLTYQWRRNGSNISGATSATYNVASAAPANSGSYDVVITPSCGTVVMTEAVTVTVNPTPTASAITSKTTCSGVETAPIALVGTPEGVTFDITGGAAIGLADMSGVTSIPSFTPIAGG